MAETTRMHPLASEAELDQAAEHSMREPVVVFKHSRYCGSSFRAQREVHRLTEAGDPPVYEVVVQDARSVSSQIAEWLSIRHQTPQAIVVYRGQPLFHASHRRVTAEAIRQAVAALNDV